MIKFTCDRCGETLTIPLSKFLRNDGSGEYIIEFNSTLDTCFDTFKTVNNCYLLCDTCRQRYATVVQDTIDRTAESYVKGELSKDA